MFNHSPLSIPNIGGAQERLRLDEPLGRAGVGDAWEGITLLSSWKRSLPFVTSEAVEGVGRRHGSAEGQGGEGLYQPGQSSAAPGTEFWIGNI